MYIYTHTHHGYYSAIKENEIMPFAATWMDLEMIIVRELSWTEKEKYHYGILHMWNLQGKEKNELT